jgi:phenylpropionate dioxygenase-like ring-hydroxylating dioxygenase large terminal subunit
MRSSLELEQAVTVTRAGSLVDVENGEISRTIFTNPALYAAEQKQVFARAWLYVGHESQIRNRGDFVLSKMGEESVILTRDQVGKVRVHLNSCRHRGMKICRYDEGNTKLFYCPYHAWSYGTDGTLVAVQDYENAYKPGFDKSQWGLIQVAKVALLRGTVWATWDPEAPSFEDYLGEAWKALDVGLRPWDGGDGETELLGAPQKWIIPSNWKVVAENFAGDVLHGVSHRSVDIVGIGPKEGGGRRDDPGRIVLSAFPQGHGLLFGIRDAAGERNDYSASPETAAYFQETWKRRLAQMGDQAGVSPVLGTIFPNMSFHTQQPRTILVAHPRGPTTTEMWRVYFVDRDAPPAVKTFLRRYYTRYSGPGGMTEQDDMENWGYATQAAKGEISSRSPFNYKAGLNTGGPDPQVGGHVVADPLTSEQNPRQLYKRWAEFMDAPAWTDLKDPR